MVMQDGGGGSTEGSKPRRRASLMGSTKRKNSNTSIGNAINQALGNDAPDDLGLLSSEDDEIDNRHPAGSSGITRARSTSNAGRSSDAGADNDDEYHEESFSGPMHYVRRTSALADHPRTTKTHVFLLVSFP